MKKITLLFLFALLASCVTAGKKNSACPKLEISYRYKTINSSGNKVGVFLIKNVDSSKANFAYEESMMLVLHPRFMRVMQRRHADDEWQPFNIMLDEYSSPKGTISVDPDKELTFIYDANGLFIERQSSPEMEYSILIKSDAACEYRSEPFRL